MALDKKIINLILFFIIANPVMYQVTSKLPILGPLIATHSGQPTQFGVLVHSVVYVLIGALIIQYSRNK
jgi:hypothetical protein